MGCESFKKDKAAQQRAANVKQALINQGLQEPQLSWAMASAAHESNGFNSAVSKDDNNYSGIKWANYSYLNGYPKGRSAPGNIAADGTRDSGNYVHFPTTDDWARVYVGNIGKGVYLNSNRGGQGKPLQATSMDEYVRRLKANGYFQDPASVYLKGMTNWNDCLGGVKPSGTPPTVTNNAAQDNQTKSNLQNLSNNFTSMLNAINSNVDALSQDEVNVGWGSRSGGDENSDWIGLRQYLMYLAMTYKPQSLVPFIELIPKFMMDESQNVGTWAKGVLGQDNAASTDFSSISQKEATQFLKMKSKFNKSQAAGGVDLLTLDPFQEGNSFSQSGEGSNRNFGYKLFGAVVLNPGIKGEETSKAGAIGFKSLEISQGAQSNQGLTMITIKILDVQGNKFLDVSSPWSFLLNASQVNGDFYLRYGWQIQIPKMQEAKDGDQLSSAYKFWNHPGWNLFGENIKSEIDSLAQKGQGHLTLTQSQNKDSISYAGYKEEGNQDQNGIFSTFATTRDLGNTESMIKNYIIVSMINPELSVNSEDGSVTATITFLMNTAVANCLCPLSQAFELHKFVSDSKDSTVTLTDLMKKVIKCNKEFIKNHDKLKEYSKYSIDEEGDIKNWVYVQKLTTHETVDVSSIDKIKISDVRTKEINDSHSQGSSNSQGTDLKISAWIANVLKDNGIAVLSQGEYGFNTEQNSGAFFMIWDDKEHSEISSQSGDQEQSMNPSSTGGNGADFDAGTGFLGNESTDRIMQQDDVFSFRFKGSLVEELLIEKNENPSNAQQAKNTETLAEKNIGKNEITSKGTPEQQDGAGATESNDTVSLKDKKQNQWYQLTKISAATIKCICHPWLKMAKPIYVKGTGYFDGKYAIAKIRHYLGDDNKFITELNCVRVMDDKDYTSKHKQNDAQQVMGMNNGFMNWASPMNNVPKGPYSNEFLQKSQLANFGTGINFENKNQNNGSNNINFNPNTDAYTQIKNAMGISPQGIGR